MISKTWSRKSIAAVVAVSPQDTGNVLLELVSAMHDNERRVYQPHKAPKERCEHPEIGKLIEALGYDFLLETLELDQGIFAAEYPNISVGVEARQSMKENVQEHFPLCQRCQLEARNDRAWRKHFARFLKSEKELVKKILKEKRSITRGKPRSFKATP